MTDRTLSNNFEGRNISQRALEAAQRANDRMDGHERLCAERYGSIDKTMNAVLLSLRSLWHIILITGGALIVGMAGILVHQIFH